MKVDPLTSITQHIVEQHLGSGVFKPEWRQGDEYWGGIPVRWTTIECSSCNHQVYFDLTMKRHRCCSCGSGF